MSKTAVFYRRLIELYQFDYSFFRTVAATLSQSVDTGVSAALSQFFRALSVLGRDFIEKLFHKRVLNIGSSRLEFRLLFIERFNFLKVTEFTYKLTAYRKLFGAILDAFGGNFLSLCILIYSGNTIPSSPQGPFYDC